MRGGGGGTGVRVRSRLKEGSNSGRESRLPSLPLVRGGVDHD